MNLEEDCVISEEIRPTSPGAFGREHHAAVMAVILQGDVLDGEVHLHPGGVECLHLDHLPVFHQVGPDDRAARQRLQDVGDRARELDEAPHPDGRRPSRREVGGVNIGCKSKGTT